MSVAFTLYLMCKVFFYMRIVHDASGMNVLTGVYISGWFSAGIPK